MKKVLLLVFFLTSICLRIDAQQFSKAVGIRCGLSSGFEYRFYTDDINSYKILLGSRDKGVQLTIMKEFHKYEVFDFSEQLVFIYGLGIHAGFEHWYVDRFLERHNYEPNTLLLAGLDGLAAVEYTFNKIPFSAGIEVKPFFDVWGRRTFDIELFDFAFTLKYLF